MNENLVIARVGEVLEVVIEKSDDGSCLQSSRTDPNIWQKTSL
jgi:hypothetical protein